MSTQNTLFMLLLIVLFGYGFFEEKTNRIIPFLIMAFWVIIYCVVME